jgi:hypothetical protein
MYCGTPDTHVLWSPPKAHVDRTSAALVLRTDECFRAAHGTEWLYLTDLLLWLEGGWHAPVGVRDGTW